MDDDLYSEPVSLKQKLKQSLCFSCCFPHRRRNRHYRYAPSDDKPTLIWVEAAEPRELPEVMDKCRTVLDFVGNVSFVKHKRPSSAEFRYDPLSYALNFEDGYEDDDDAAPLRNFSARLPPSPPPKPVKSAAAAAAVAVA